MTKSTAKRRAILVGYLFAFVAAANAANPTMPTFFARRDYTSLNSNWVQVADTNGDGIPDLIGTLYGAMEVLFGNGDGTFRPGPTSLTVVQATSFLAVALSGNGTVDLVGVGNFGVYPYASGIRCFGNGDGTFQSGVFYPVPDAISYAVIGDFNGDGIPDIATGGNMGVWLLTGKGGGVFNPAVLAASVSGTSGSIAAADFNGDGKLDLVLVMPKVGFAVLLGNGNGTFQSPHTFTQNGAARGLAAGKLAKGGHPGIVLSDYNNASIVYVYLGNGKAGFSAPQTVNLSGAIDGVAIGDINGDGIPDLVSAGGYIAFGGPSGKFKSPVYYPVQNTLSEYINVVLADLRNNGLTDIVTDNPSGVSVLLALGNGKYEDGVWTTVTGGAGCGAAADFNLDGKPDLAVNNAQGVSILLGTGKPKPPFTTGPTIALANAGCLVTGDLNGDGIPDLLVPANGTVVTYLGNGDGTFTLKSTTAIPSGGSLALGDFNHDGKLDFATSGNLLALGNGDGTFQAPAAFVPNPPAGGFSNIAAGDINNDGWPDLVLVSASVPGSNAYVLLNNQHGGFTQVPPTFGAQTFQAILADVNGDGNLDVVLQSISSGVANIYLGDGTGAFTLKLGLGGCAGFTGVDMVADLNGDGIPDIAMLQSDTLTVYLGEGGATYAPQFCVGTGPSPGDVLVENLHGQSPTSGLPDIVAPDTSGGVMVLTNKTK